LDTDDLVVGGKNIGAPEAGVVMTVLVSMIIITMRREFVQICIHFWKMTNDEALMTKE
jgi:hypothetical protein